LILRARNGNDIAGHFGAGEIDLAVPLLLKFFDFWHSSNELTMVESIDVDILRDKFGILSQRFYISLLKLPFLHVRVTHDFLHHIHDLLLDKIQALGISSGSTTDDVIHLDVFVLFSDSTAVHRVGELDEDGVLLHDPLNMLSTNTNDTLVILIWNMEGDGSRHLLFDEIKAISSSLVLIPTHVNVEIVFIEAVKDDLYVA
jgi:hypothetical protein